MRFFRLVLALTLIFCTTLAAWQYAYIRTPGPGSGEATVFIPRGAGVRQIGVLLEESGLIRNDVRFLVLVRLTDSAGRLRAGEFRLARGLRPGEVLEHLRSGPVVQHRVTVPEGFDLAQICGLFAGQGWGDEQALRELAVNHAFLASLGIEQASAEGYLFPDTYSLAWGEVDEASILTMMIRRFNAVWEELAPGAGGQDRHEVVTLASIIEKETGAPEERPVIAAVFLNRLRLGMRLQSDPTVLYGREGDNGPLTKADLRRDTPYNTYVIDGLPPGPICSPGQAALQAVLQPAATRALYFVSRNDGTHHFSETLREHNRMVRKYQRGGRK